ncbi:MAG: capsular biosynthesis protein, partial [Pseudomonadota bacterium]
RHAPRDRHLVVKGHPMDNGWENWPRRLRNISRRAGVETRVHWLDGGALSGLLERACGVMTVNSTVGIHAIRQRCQVMALGSAIYDVDGITHQGGLDRFWRHPDQVNHDLRKAFLCAISAWIQVRGSFINPAGRAIAVKNIVQRLEYAEKYWMFSS